MTNRLHIKVHEAFTDPYTDALDKEWDEIVAQGKKDIRSFNPDAVKIGDQVWMSKNLAIDDGGEGIFYNPKNKEHYYTWDAAVRIAKAISGWHLPSVDEWNEACEACGVEPIDGRGYVEDARELNDRLKVLPAGYYTGSFYGVGSYAYFWTFTESGSDAYSRYFDTGATMRQSTSSKDRGFSVRLVKDS